MSVSDWLWIIWVGYYCNTDLSVTQSRYSLRSCVHEMLSDWIPVMSRAGMFHFWLFHLATLPLSLSIFGYFAFHLSEGGERLGEWQQVDTVRSGLVLGWTQPWPSLLQVQREEWLYFLKPQREMYTTCSFLYSFLARLEILSISKSPPNVSFPQQNTENSFPPFCKWLPSYSSSQPRIWHVHWWCNSSQERTDCFLVLLTTNFSSSPAPAG